MNYTIENFINFCNDMMIANESDNSFKSSNDVSNYILKTYSGSNIKSSNIKLIFNSKETPNKWDGRNIWLDDIGKSGISSDELLSILNKMPTGTEKEYCGYIKEWISNENNEYDKYNTKCIKKLLSLSLVKVAHDGGGTEFSYDVKSKKFYLFDHDYGFILHPLSPSNFIALCRKLVAE